MDPVLESPSELCFESLHTGEGDKSVSEEVTQTPISKDTEDDKEEVIPLNEGSDISEFPVDETVDDTHGERSGVIQRIKHDAVYRENVFLSLTICWTFFVLGWVVGQFGPALPELQIITGSPLEKASAFLTAGATGYMVGSLLSGILFDRLNKHLLVCSFTVCGFVNFIIIPWCYRYELMIVVQFCRGMFGGGLDAGGNALLVWTWEGDGRSFMQAIHFAFAIGGIVSPMVIVPFLSKMDNDANVNHSLSLTPEVNISDSQVFTGISSHRSEKWANNFTSFSTAPYSDRPGQSKLYVDFLITSALHLSCAVPLFLLYIRAKKQHSCTKESKADGTISQVHQKVDSSRKIVEFCTICLFLALNAALENTFNYLLVTFCIEQMTWTKVQGSFATSLFWATFGTGRFLGIWLIKMLKPVVLIGVFTTSLGFVFLAFVVFSYLKIDAGIWACAVSAGAAMSIIFPTVFTWTNESFITMSGKVASLFLISASCGAMINPILLGYLMENFTPMWFAYLLFGDSVAAIAVYIIMLLLVRRQARTCKEPAEEATM
ncbi:sodium-dependent glucose transporter 1-like [Pecten maximus]|uniref:sodium-dependent glucose transporter 1-like n=1 Tax=Pecten maximus TaxID=6579 RepID=UPI00145865CE|nr:sodium-dependent glucose transporter 1-like [Pecten maximus]